MFEILFQVFKSLGNLNFVKTESVIKACVEDG